MAAKQIPRPSAKAQLATGTLVGALDPSIVSRHLSELGDSLEQSQSGATPSRFQGVVSLAVGTNRISHGLGRVARGATVTPMTSADATFAWAMTAADAMTAVITVVGVAQKAFVEVF